jgi:hypothetical protein
LEKNKYNYARLNLRRAIPTIPTRPVPKSAREAGSGTAGAGVADADAENDVGVPMPWTGEYCEVNVKVAGLSV